MSIISDSDPISKCIFSRFKCQNFEKTVALEILWYHHSYLGHRLCGMEPAILTIRISRWFPRLYHFVANKNVVEFANNCNETDCSHIFAMIIYIQFPHEGLCQVQLTAQREEYILSLELWWLMDCTHFMFYRHAPMDLILHVIVIMASGVIKNFLLIPWIPLNRATDSLELWFLLLLETVQSNETVGANKPWSDFT